MRNLEDCKAEVFRRSEERIKERKRKRNRVLACCIPLCLLLVAGGFYIRPLLEPVDELGGINSENYAIPERELGGVAESEQVGIERFVSVEITDKTGSEEVSRNVTDAETVGALGDFMTLYFGMPVLKTNTINDESDGKEPSRGTEKEGTTAGADRDTIDYELGVKYGLEEKQADYVLVFRIATGDEFLFRLNENCLYNEENGCVVTLPDAQLTTLKEMLDSTK